MTRQGWAERKVACRDTAEHGDAGNYVHESTAVRLLLAEHRRAVRAVKRLTKQAHLDEFSMSADQLDAYLEALNDVLAALQKGLT